MSIFKGSPAFKELALKHLAKIIAGRYLDEYDDGSTNEAKVRDFFMRAGLEASSLDDCTESGIYTILLQLQLSGFASRLKIGRNLQQTELLMSLNNFATLKNISTHRIIGTRSLTK